MHSRFSASPAVVRRVFAALLAATALGAGPAAQAADCVSRAESRAVAAYLLPDIVRQAGAVCAPALGPDAFLTREADGFARSLTPQAERRWPVAKRALERHLGTALPDRGILLDLGRAGLVEGIVRDLDGPACATLDRLAVELAPLPPENLANIAALALEAGLDSDPKAAVRVCPAP